MLPHNPSFNQPIHPNVNLCKCRFSQEQSNEGNISELMDFWQQSLWCANSRFIYQYRHSPRILHSSKSESPRKIPVFAVQLWPLFLKDSMAQKEHVVPFDVQNKETSILTFQLWTGKFVSGQSNGCRIAISLSQISVSMANLLLLLWKKLFAQNLSALIINPLALLPGAPCGR